MGVGPTLMQHEPISILTLLISAKILILNKGLGFWLDMNGDGAETVFIPQQWPSQRPCAVDVEVKTEAQRGSVSRTS